jgi:hypothetical protein
MARKSPGFELKSRHHVDLCLFTIVKSSTIASMLRDITAQTIQIHTDSPYIHDKGTKTKKRVRFDAKGIGSAMK